MFQLLRARAHNYIKARLGNDGFKARSADRDAETDRARIGSILTAIETALQAAESEQSGLSRRVDDVLGTCRGDDWQRNRRISGARGAGQLPSGLFDAEILNGQRRLKELAAEIAHFKFMKAAMLSRFPDFKAQAPGN